MALVAKKDRTYRAYRDALIPAAAAAADVDTKGTELNADFPRQWGRRFLSHMNALAIQAGLVNPELLNPVKE